MRFPRVIIAGALLASGSGILKAQAPDDIQQRIRQIQEAIIPASIAKGSAPVTSKLADRMAALHVPAVSIAVIHGGKIEWARGFGVTHTGGPAVTPDTLFQAASISKPVTALAVMRLVQSGKLDLDADVNTYLKTWKVPENEFTRNSKITLRELLSHTAGMTVHGFPGYASDEPRPTTIQILNGSKPANTPAILVDTAPGTIWRYAGGGFVVTQLLLEDVTGQPFPKLMRDLVLGPAGMTRSTYEQPLPPDRMNEVAIAYSANGNPVRGGPHVYPEMAPAGLWTTPSDLARYAIDLQNGLASKPGTVVSAATAREMLKPGKNKWGLGIETGGSAAHSYFTHSGANEGYRCELIAYNSGDGAVIMTNSDNGGQLTTEILRTIAYEYRWPDFGPVEAIAVTSDTLRKYTGVYAMGGTATMTVTLSGERLVTQITGQGKAALSAESATVFHPDGIDATVEFASEDPNGPATKLTLHQNGREITARRLSPEEEKKALEAAAAFEKRFKDQTAAPGSEAAVRRMIGELQAGKPDYDLMSPGLGDATRQQLPQLQSMIAALGALQSVTFKGVGPGGADIYQAKFEKGSLDYRVWLGPDGKVQSANLRPSE